MPGMERIASRQIASSLSAGAVVAGILGGVLPLLFRLLGWAAWAAGLTSRFRLFADPRLNWETVWLVAGLIGCTALLCLHAERLWRCLAGARRSPRWTMPGAAAVCHILHRSAFGTALGITRGPAQRALCMQALMEAARAGRLPLAAIPCGRATLHPLAPERLLRLRPLWQDGSLQLTDTAGRLLYHSVMTDARQVQRLWPAADRQQHSSRLHLAKDCP